MIVLVIMILVVVAFVVWFFKKGLKLLEQSEGLAQQRIRFLFQKLESGEMTQAEKEELDAILRYRASIFSPSLWLF